MEENKDQSNTFVIDIPGQIEVFTWSSSSLILTEAIATLMPIKIAYIIDSVRCKNPNVFLSNILFARSSLTIQNLSNIDSSNILLPSCSTKATVATPPNSKNGSETTNSFFRHSMMIPVTWPLWANRLCFTYPTSIRS